MCITKGKDNKKSVKRGNVLVFLHLPSTKMDATHEKDGRYSKYRPS